MAYLALPRLLAFIALLTIAVQASPIAGSSPATLNLRIPPPPDPEDCQPPLVLCDKACCSSTSTCGSTGLCVPKPGIPKPSASIFYTNDSKGRPIVINLMIRNFHGNAFADMTYIKNSQCFSAWSPTKITEKNIVFNTGVQDCSRTGKLSSYTDGYHAYIWVYDIVGEGPQTGGTTAYWKYFTFRVPDNGGVCP